MRLTTAATATIGPAAAGKFLMRLDRGRMMNVFVYGTLMDRDIMSRVSGGAFHSARALLRGYVRRTVAGEVYPGIVRRTGETVQGVLYLDLPQRALDRLDRFEGSLYRRSAVTVILESGACITAHVYVISGEHAHRLSEAPWDYEDFQRRGKARFLAGYEGWQGLD